MPAVRAGDEVQFQRLLRQASVYPILLLAALAGVLVGASAAPRRVALLDLGLLLAGAASLAVLARCRARRAQDLHQRALREAEARSEELARIEERCRRLADEACAVERRNTEELERRVAERTVELAAVNRELEAFSYSVSHDLRAPLRAIDGFSQALLEEQGERLEPRAMEYLRRTRNASQRMSQILEDLIRLSRVARSELKREPVDLSALFREVAAEIRERGNGRTVLLVAEDGLRAHCDPRLLRVALENLVGNAYKFTRHQQEPRVEFGVAAGEGGPVFFIRDNGAGFDMAQAEKLFKPFQRLHSAAQFEGSGIGLATLQRIVLRHGGRVWAEGEPGRGAAFYFTLGEA